jgi:hypothetical protein
MLLIFFYRHTWNSYNRSLCWYLWRLPKKFPTTDKISVLGSSTLASCFFWAFRGFWGGGEWWWGEGSCGGGGFWGGDFVEGRSGEWCWRGCACGGFWGGDIGEGRHGGECSSVSRATLSWSFWQMQLEFASLLFSDEILDIFNHSNNIRVWSDYWRS